MTEAPLDLRGMLLRQRRFLILMSLAVIAYYVLDVRVQNKAEYSGLVLTLERPERTVIVLWVVWGWSLWRYRQRVYELLSVIWNDLLEDVRAEDLRIALARAKKVGNRLAAAGQLEGTPSTARVRDRVTNGQPLPEDMLDELVGVEEIPSFRDYFPTRSGGRKYPALKATFDWTEGANWGTGEADFKMELTRREAHWLRSRAWLHSFLRLPAFTEHVAPVLIALAAVGTSVVHRCAT